MQGLTIFFFEVWIAFRSIHISDHILLLIALNLLNAILLSANSFKTIAKTLHLYKIKKKRLFFLYVYVSFPFSYISEALLLNLVVCLLLLYIDKCVIHRIWVKLGVGSLGKSIRKEEVYFLLKRRESMTLVVPHYHTLLMDFPLTFGGLLLTNCYHIFYLNLLY